MGKANKAITCRCNNGAFFIGDRISQTKAITSGNVATVYLLTTSYVMHMICYSIVKFYSIYSKPLKMQLTGIPK